MMIVMLCSKERNVDQAHRRAQARMPRGVFERRPACGVQDRDELKPKGTEPTKQVIQWSRVVIRFICAVIGQIGDCELALALQQLLRASDPERFQIAQVADVLLY
jgi:hypothetical protein